MSILNFWDFQATIALRVGRKLAIVTGGLADPTFPIDPYRRGQRVLASFLRQSSLQ